MDRGAWRVTVHGVAKIWTWLSTYMLSKCELRNGDKILSSQQVSVICLHPCQDSWGLQKEQKTNPYFPVTWTTVEELIQPPNAVMIILQEHNTFTFSKCFHCIFLSYICRAKKYMIKCYILWHLFVDVVGKIPFEGKREREGSLFSFIKKKKNPAKNKGYSYLKQYSTLSNLLMNISFRYSKRKFLPIKND